jgi:hypothetical protein
VLEIAPAKLADALGDKQQAATLIERAKRILAASPPPAPSPVTPVRPVGRAAGRKTPKKKP